MIFNPFYFVSGLLAVGEMERVEKVMKKRAIV
jgi:hypothetical protein